MVTASDETSPQLPASNSIQNSLNGNTSEANANSPQQPRRIRVKVFLRETSEGEWSEKGTGYLFTGVEENESTDGPAADEQKCMHVISEIDGAKILQSQIDPTAVHEKQEETIIVWAEPNKECALSFQFKQDCDEIFAYIQTVKKSDPSCSSDFLAPSESCLELPKCDINNLEALADALEQCLIYSDAYECVIEQGDYLNKIINIIKDHQSDSKFSVSRRFVSRIVTSLIYFNKQHILDVLMSIENIYYTIEALQYDPQSGELTKNHREIVEKKSTLNHLISATKDEILKEKIEHTYLMQYILDNFFVPHSSMDKSRILTLYSAIHLNNVEIVSIVLEHTDDLENLIMTLKAPPSINGSNPDNDLDSSINILNFFLELCECVKPIDKKDDFFNVLTNLNFYDGLYSLIKRVKSTETQNKIMQNKVVRLAVSLIKKLIDFNIDSFHRYTYKNRIENEKSGEKNICDFLIEIMHADLFSIPRKTILSVKMDQITDIMTSISIFSELLGYSFTEKDYNNITLNCFKSDFFNHYAYKIFVPLTIVCEPNNDEFTQWHAFLIDNLLRLMNQILSHPDDFNKFHSFLSRNDILNQMSHIVPLRNYTFVNEILSIISCLFFNSDQTVQRNVMKSTLSDSLFKAIPNLISNHSIFTGGLSDLLNKIRLDSNSFSLMSHVVENYDEILSKFSLTSTYKDLKDRFNDLKDSSNMFNNKIDYSNSQENFISSTNFALKTSDNSFSDEINEEKYFGNNTNIENIVNKGENNLTELDAKRKKLDSQYDNIFMGLKLGSSKLNNSIQPGLYSPRPNDPLNKKININLGKNEDNDLNTSGDDLGLKQSEESSVPVAALVDYSTSSDEDEEEQENTCEGPTKKLSRKETVKKLKLNTDDLED